MWYIQSIHTILHTYIHTYIHMYVHTYIHTYIHTYLCHGEQVDQRKEVGYKSSTAHV